MQKGDARPGVFKWFPQISRAPGEAKAVTGTGTGGHCRGQGQEG